MKTILATVPVVISLAACVDSSGPLAVDVGTPNEAFAASQTLSTENGSISARRMSYRDNTTEIITEPSDITLSLNSAGAVIVGYKGQTYELGEDARVFNEADQKYYGLEKSIDVKDGSGEVEYIGLWSQEGDLDSVLAVDREDYAQVWQLWTEEQGAPGEAAFFVVGTKTAETALGAFTTSDYNGFALAQIVMTEGNPNNRTQVRFLETSMSVNFQTNELSGQMSGAQVRQRVFDEAQNKWVNTDYSDIDGAVNISSGAISGNGFTATASANDALLTSGGYKSVEASVDGSFYGPSADQAAGTFTGSAMSNEGQTAVVNGWFDVSK